MKKGWIALAIFILLTMCVPGLAELSLVPGGPEDPIITPTPEPTPELVPLPLAGVTIGINAGHQKHGNYGSEPLAPGSKKRKYKCASGTTGRKTGTPEYKLTLQMALKLRDELQARGATVVMARETHNVNISNAQRAKIFNKAGVDLAIHLHCNGGKVGVRGAQMYTVGARYTSKEIASQSLRAGKLVLSAMCKATKAKKRGTSAATSFASLNYTKMPALLFEVGFLTDPTEERKLIKASYQQKIATGIADGMEDYFATLAP